MGERRTHRFVPPGFFRDDAVLLYVELLQGHSSRLSYQARSFFHSFCIKIFSK